MPFSSFHTLMTEQQLNGAQWGFVFQQSNRECVAESVGVAVYRGQSPEYIQGAPETTNRCTQFASPIPEEVLIGFLRELFECKKNSHGNADIQRVPGLLLSEQYPAGGHIHLRTSELDRITDSQAGIQQHQNEGTCSKLGSLKNVPVVVLYLVRRCQKSINITLLKRHGRDDFGNRRWFEGFGRGFGDVIVPNTPVKKRPQIGQLFNSGGRLNCSFVTKTLKQWWADVGYMLNFTDTELLQRTEQTFILGQGGVGQFPISTICQILVNRLRQGDVFRSGKLRSGLSNPSLSFPFSSRPVSHAGGSPNPFAPVRQQISVDGALAISVLTRRVRTVWSVASKQLVCRINRLTLFRHPNRLTHSHAIVRGKLNCFGSYAARYCFRRTSFVQQIVNVCKSFILNTLILGWLEGFEPHTNHLRAIM